MARAQLADEPEGTSTADLDGTPGIVIHGRFDVSSPQSTAFELSRRWKTSTLQVLDDAGHGNNDSFPEAVVGALNQLGSGQRAGV